MVGPAAAPPPVQPLWGLRSQAATLLYNPGGGHFLYAWQDARATHNTVTATIRAVGTAELNICAAISQDGHYRLGAQIVPTINAIRAIIGPPDVFAAGVPIPAAPFTVTASYNAGTETLTVTVNGTTASTLTLTAAQTATFAPLTLYALSGLSISGMSVDDISLDGALVDDFNRPDSPRLGVDLIGNAWQYSISP